MTDLADAAVALARINADLNGAGAVRIVQGDGFAPIADRDFTLILCNPPYHSDFAVAKGFIEHAFSHLLLGGRLYMVTKRLDWYRNKLSAIFGGVKVQEIDGYYVFMAEKRSPRLPVKDKKTPHLSKKLARKIQRKPGSKR
jgi:16S rRNA (guanine1207-N2)-methyltransferase